MDLIWSHISPKRHFTTGLKPLLGLIGKAHRMGGITGSGPLNMIAEASNPEDPKYNNFEGASLISINHF